MAAAAVGRAGPAGPVGPAGAALSAGSATGGATAAGVTGAAGCACQARQAALATTNATTATKAQRCHAPVWGTTARASGCTGVTVLGVSMAGRRQAARPSSQCSNTAPKRDCSFLDLQYTALSSGCRRAGSSLQCPASCRRTSNCVASSSSRGPTTKPAPCRARCRPSRPAALSSPSLPGSAAAAAFTPALLRCRCASLALLPAAQVLVELGRVALAFGHRGGGAACAGQVGVVRQRLGRSHLGVGGHHLGQVDQL